MAQIDSTSLPLDPAAYRHFLLYDGYAESGVLSPVIVSHNYPLDTGDTEFKTWQEAWEFMFNHFRRVFLDIVRMENGLPAKDVPDSEWMININDCCGHALKGDKKFCPDCGTKLDKYRPTSPEDLGLLTDYCSDFLSMVASSDNDSFNYDYCELMSSNGWNLPGYFEDDGIITFVSHKAAWMLANLEGAKTSWLWNEEKNFWSNVSFGRYSLLTP